MDALNQIIIDKIEEYLDITSIYLNDGEEVTLSDFFSDFEGFDVEELSDLLTKEIIQYIQNNTYTFQQSVLFSKAAALLGNKIKGRCDKCGGLKGEWSNGMSSIAEEELAQYGNKVVLFKQ